MRQTSAELGPTGQWFTSASGHRWWFDSGSLALDFAYTGAMGENPAWERLHTPSDLAEWLSERFTSIDGTVTDRDLVDAKALRSAVARLATATSRREEPGRDDVDVINLFAATPDIPPSLPGGSRQAGRTRARASQALSAMAREAIGLFGAESAGRIRECSADDCALVFYDDSRSNNRRWCSMQRCGNRAKVRAHRARS
ncbi:MAG TPA: CGNR zinc finger domain-containing protein [Lacisediminihabitans sp.]|nr:CGNR zinc finger domain-containing protein [Lacisediminihabitans sp.]HXD60611.1 CGNR zinc finger domain-containing protein [Lacisediminihabitans sp.]